VEDGVRAGYGRLCVFRLGQDQPNIAKAGVPTTTDDQVVVYRYAERAAALMMSLVTAMSAVDGLGSPEG
jgi:hypothetical protein